MTDRTAPPVALPGVLADIARAVSPEVAISIARRYGGRRMYVPLEPGPHHPLTQLLGVRVARLIGERVGREEVSWPSAKALLRAWDARQLRRDGLSVAEIGRRIGISERHAERLVAGVEKGERASGPDHANEPGACPACGHRPRRRVVACRHEPAQLDLFEWPGN